MFETPGVANITLETIAKIAAALRSGVIIKFVPFSEMLQWENSFSPDAFNVKRLAEDAEFINPVSVSFINENQRFAGLSISGNDDLGYADFEENPLEKIGLANENQQAARARAVGE
jgi:hypothetical protein